MGVASRGTRRFISSLEKGEVLKASAKAREGISGHNPYLEFFTLLFHLYSTELYGILRANLMTAKASDAP